MALAAASVFTTVVSAVMQAVRDVQYPRATSLEQSEFGFRIISITDLAVAEYSPHCDDEC